MSQEVVFIWHSERIPIIEEENVAKQLKKLIDWWNLIRWYSYHEEDARGTKHDHEDHKLLCGGISSNSHEISFLVVHATSTTTSSSPANYRALCGAKNWALYYRSWVENETHQIPLCTRAGGREERGRARTMTKGKRTV